MGLKEGWEDKQVGVRRRGGAEMLVLFQESWVDFIDAFVYSLLNVDLGCFTKSLNSKRKV